MFNAILVEDDPHVCQKLKRILEGFPCIRVRNCFYNLASAKAYVKRHRVDLLILDLGLPDGNGLELVQFINKSPLNAKALKLLLTIFDDFDTFSTAIEHGINGYVVKTGSDNQIIQSIDSVVNGHAYISPEVASYLLMQYHKKDEIQLLSALTVREAEVLKLLALGLSYKCISKKLNVKYSTVCSHIKSIYSKLDVSSKSEAIYKGLKTGLVNINEQMDQVS